MEDALHDEADGDDDDKKKIHLRRPGNSRELRASGLFLLRLLALPVLTDAPFFAGRDVCLYQPV